MPSQAKLKGLELLKRIQTFISHVTGSADSNSSCDPLPKSKKDLLSFDSEPSAVSFNPLTNKRHSQS